MTPSSTFRKTTARRGRQLWEIGIPNRNGSEFFKGNDYADPTISLQYATLFPGDVSATKLWDVAFTSDSGFLIVVIVACTAAILLWRKGTALSSKIVLLVGAILGAWH